MIEQSLAEDVMLAHDLRQLSATYFALGDATATASPTEGLGIVVRGAEVEFTPFASQS